MSETARVLELAERLAREAGALQRERYETNLEIRTKSAPIDLVTEVDHACEQLIVGALAAERPDDAIVAEEGGGNDRPDATWRWIIDPLDGTTNYAHGYPRFCVSIGVEHEGIRSVGVVYDPLLDELYCATRGQGAVLNGRPLRVSGEGDLGRSLIATGFAYDVHGSPTDNLGNLGAVVKQARGIRRDGSAALNLCYVAAGRFDGYWELKLHAWDVAAGLLLVEEAGGRVSDLRGGPPPRSGSEIIASNGGIHEALVEVLAGGSG
jgi:myo-inositol-1(or 4)-monophosphatase